MNLYHIQYLRFSNTDNSFKGLVNLGVHSYVIVLDILKTQFNIEITPSYKRKLLSQLSTCQGGQISLSLDKNEKEYLDFIITTIIPQN
jgi:hypothetical protein